MSGNLSGGAVELDPDTLKKISKRTNRTSRSLSDIATEYASKAFSSKSISPKKKKGAIELDLKTLKAKK